MTEGVTESQERFGAVLSRFRALQGAFCSVETCYGMPHLLKRQMRDKS